MAARGFTRFPATAKFRGLADLVLPILPVAAVCVHAPSIGNPRVGRLSFSLSLKSDRRNSLSLSLTALIPY